jgi:type IV secretion system protein TrbL
MDSTILTDILSALVNATSDGFNGVRENAEDLFYQLLVIELVLFGIGIALNRVDVQRELVAKILAIGFVQFLLFRYVWLVDSLRDGFVGVGLYAAGSNISISESEFLDPSAFIDTGFAKVFEVIESRFNEQGVWNFLTTPSLIWLLHGVALLIMFFAFAAVGLQIFLSVAEFYLISTLAIILIPFLVLQRTTFLGLRAVNGLVAICMKLMVIAFVASLSAPVIELLSFTSSEPTIKESMSLAVGALAIALLMWRAPAIAMSLISGTGGLDAGATIISPVLRGTNLVSGTGHILSGVAKTGGNVVGSVSKAASTGGGNVKGT